MLVATSPDHQGQKKCLTDRGRIVAPSLHPAAHLREPPLPARLVLLRSNTAPVLLIASDCHRCPGTAIITRMCATTTVPGKSSRAETVPAP